MKVLYNQKCARCPKMVPITSRKQFPLCYDCQKKELQGEIKDPKMKKLFDIPEEFYKNSPFLRSIKAYYLKFGEITDRQKEYFEKTVKEMKAESKKNDRDAILTKEDVKSLNEAEKDLKEKKSKRLNAKRNL